MGEKTKCRKPIKKRCKTKTQKKYGGTRRTRRTRRTGRKSNVENKITLNEIFDKNIDKIFIDNFYTAHKKNNKEFFEKISEEIKKRPENVNPVNPSENFIIEIEFPANTFKGNSKIKVDYDEYKKNMEINYSHLFPWKLILSNNLYNNTIFYTAHFKINPVHVDGVRDSGDTDEDDNLFDEDGNFYDDD